MGKIVATYLLKVTLRDPIDRESASAEGEVTPVKADPPTNDVLAGVIEDEIGRKFAGSFDAHVTSERTDE